MQKSSLQDGHILHITDIINNKVSFEDSQVYKVKEEYERLQRPRTMSDPLSRDYYRQAQKNRYPESFGRNNQCCKKGNGDKHTHFANSKQIAQSIYPDFLSSLPNENPAELKKIVKKLLSDNEERKNDETIDVQSGKGPSKKALLAWYRREYGLSFDEAKANIT